MPETQFDARFAIAKADEPKGLVFGWANISKTADGKLILDSQDHVIEIDDLELAAYDFVLSAYGTGDMHEGEPVGRLVESMIFTPEKVEKLGLEGDVPLGWWVGFHIPDADQFAKVQSGERAMFSIQGTALAEDIDAP